jgi:hypothetical protein
LLLVAAAPRCAAAGGAAKDAPPRCTGSLAAAPAALRQSYAPLLKSVVDGPFYKALVERSGPPQSCTRAVGDGGLTVELRAAKGGRLTARIQPEAELSETRLELRGLSEAAAEKLLRAEEKAAFSDGCGIAWDAPEKEPAAGTVVWRGDTCNCQARAQHQRGKPAVLLFRSAC